jgi:hypothetical protein
MVEVDTLLAEGGVSSLASLGKLAKEDPGVAAFLCQMLQPPQTSDAGVIDGRALRLVSTDFFREKVLHTSGLCHESIELVRCPKVSEGVTERRLVFAIASPRD